MKGIIDSIRGVRDKNDTVSTAPQRCHLAHDKRFSYYLHQPDTPSPERVLVLVHGISRNAAALLNAFVPQANAAGYMVIAPLFARGVCNDFQRLGRVGKGPRADWVLDAILDDVGSQLGLALRRFAAFGFSAGAQFLHRYAMAHPQRVAAMALGAAGWYTLPNRDRYPYGLRLRSELPGVHFDPARFLRVPARVYVGDKDIERDPALNRSHRVEKKQGPHRVARAATWVEAMNRQAAKLGLPPCASVEIMPGVGHAFAEAAEHFRLPEKVMTWLARQEQAASMSGRQEMEANS